MSANYSNMSCLHGEQTSTFVTKDPWIWWESKSQIFIPGASAYKVSVTNSRCHQLNYDLVV